MNKQQFFEQRNQEIYDLFRNGCRYRILAREFEMTESGIKQILMRHRRENNLPCGRKNEK